MLHQRGNISTLKGGHLKQENKFTYLGSSVSSTENDINTQLANAWTAIDWLLVIWKSKLTDKIKRSFFQVEIVSILLYGCTTWTLTKRMEKKLDEKMLRATSHKKATLRTPTAHHKNYQKRARHAGHCWWSKDELISDIFQWTSSYGRAKVGRPARTYIQQLSADTRCSLEDLPGAMDDREGWREKEIRAGSVTWWWWCWWYVYIYIYIYIYICNPRKKSKG